MSLYERELIVSPIMEQCLPTKYKANVQYMIEDTNTQIFLYIVFSLIKINKYIAGGHHDVVNTEIAT